MLAAVANAATVQTVLAAVANAATVQAVLVAVAMMVAVEVARVATGQTVLVAVANAATVQAVAAAEERVVMDQTVPEIEFQKLALTTGLLHFEKSGKSLFFAPDLPNWLVVNSNSAVLLLNCDGQCFTSEILDSIGLSGEPRQGAYTLFEEAQRRGILSSAPPHAVEECAAQCSCSSKNSNPQGSLRSVYLKLTDECNLYCKYCYAGSGKPSDTLTNNDLSRILEEITEISETVEFVLSGGEPLLHPSALDFAEAAVAAGHSVQLLTNGSLITTDNMARRIASTTNLVKISVDGSTDDIHSISRGKGNYEQVTKAVDLLIKHGANVQVAMTVTKKNVRDLSNMSAIYGSRLALQPLFKAGRGKGDASLSLSGEEYYRAMDAVDNIAPMGNVAAVLESLRGRGVKKCALADREISISETGDVYPCQLLHAPEFLAGNIHTNSLAGIYFDNSVLDELRKVNVDTLEECAKCPIRLICAGGCRARDFYESGSIKTVGEFCEYEKLAFINGLLDYSEIE